jgi:DNA polymerase-3 subunit delta'
MTSENPLHHQWQVNRNVLERFSVLDRKKRLAHAYLLVGPSGIGKTDTAVAVAKLINCEAHQRVSFCDACSSCIKINSGNHPDVAIIEPEESGSIKIEQVRDLLNRNRLRAFMARMKVFIVKDIENLTLDGANAFLKTLEEPSKDTLLILTTSSPDTVLETIKSRCHKIPFPSMSDGELAGRLRDDDGIEEERARLFTYFAQGSLAAARRLQDGRFDDRKNVFIDEYILNRPEEADIKALLADKEETKNFLNILLSWMRDAMLVKAGVRDERLVHMERIGALNAFQRRYTFAELNALHESVVRMCQLLAENLNIKLPLLIIGEQLWDR